jgi:acyl-CoA reductase-like NAD-dependent aldehyde dehydrogenase
MFGFRKKDKNETALPVYSMTINGQAAETHNKAEVLNPATLEPVGYMPICTPAQLDEAVAAANAAQKAWAARPDEERKEICRKMAALIGEHAAELAELTTKEQGKPLKTMGSEFELGGAQGWMAYTAELDMPVKILQDDETGRIEQHRVPVGVIGSITPWNWPAMIAVWHIAPAIRAGNAVVIKPSENTPLGTLRLVEILNQVLPAGVLNCVSGTGEIGALMSKHEGINKIVFTGSTPTGQKIMQSSAGNLKRLTLELGGNDAGIVLPGTSPKAIGEGLFWGAFINMGQTCACMKRLYVHESIYDETCEVLKSIAEQMPMGNGADEATVIGPLQNEKQLNIVIDLVEDAKARGARILTGGARAEGPGYFYPVTLVADIQHGARLVDEEQFGTALPIIKYSSVDDAIAQANSLNVGLGASVWGSDLEEAQRVASQVEAGTVWINQHGQVAPHAPFGGIKGSGIGVEFGQEGLEANTAIKLYNIAKGGVAH